MHSALDVINTVRIADNAQSADIARIVFHVAEERLNHWQGSIIHGTKLDEEVSTLCDICNRSLTALNHFHYEIYHHYNPVRLREAQACSHTYFLANLFSSEQRR